MRTYNFSAGPAMLPAAALEIARAEMLEWRDGMSVMEVSHRSKEFSDVIAHAEQQVRDLLKVPDGYHVIFMQGGATAQFSAIPLNLLGTRGLADYAVTGMWGKKAAKEAQKYCEVNIVASSEGDGFNHIPDFKTWKRNEYSAYCHITPNETIGGVEFHQFPETNDVPLVADMSSTLFSRPIDVEKFGLIYASAQKNFGPAGIALVIVRDDLLQATPKWCPSMLEYKPQIEEKSCLNTPPTFVIYMISLVLDWMTTEGGLSVLAKRNEEKARRLYEYIDGTDFYRNPVEPHCRSWMNVPFLLKDDRLDNAFKAGSKAAGLENLAGHRSVGGMRASIYNAMPIEGVDALITFMKDFAQKNG
jgi:phosphoserine aminotransferase